MASAIPRTRSAASSLTDNPLAALSRRRHLGQVLAEAAQVLAQPLDRAVLLGNMLARVGRSEEHPDGELGLGALLFEDDRGFVIHRLDILVPAMLVDQTLGLND